MEHQSGARAVALVGPAGAGKTSLAEALLFASGAIGRQGMVANGTSTGDGSAESRARGGSTELNLMRFDYLGDGFSLLDTPGAIGFAADGDMAVAAADVAVVVIDPDEARAGLAEPWLRRLEELGVPRAIFVNKVDQGRGSISALLDALQPMSAAPLVARQIPIREGEKVTGCVDLALERAYHYRTRQESERIEIPGELKEREAEDRFRMLEKLSDHDDYLLEKLLSDEAPELETVVSDLAREAQAGLVVPVVFGSALNGFGVHRLLKMLRHETATADAAAERLGIRDAAALVVKVTHGNQIGRLAYARLFGGRLAEGGELTDAQGEKHRVGGLFAVQGGAVTKLSAAQAGEMVAVAKVDAAVTGAMLGIGARSSALVQSPRRALNAALAITTRDRKDDVRLSTALQKLIEEDPSLAWEHDEALHETLLRGVNDEHLMVTLAKLKRRYGVDVETRKPRIAYRESIRKPATQRGRHKKQSGGHGQFGDVVIEVRPQGRGEGFLFGDRITGGAIPKQWIPAVEDGVKDAMLRGPLGFPVVDIAVTLTDGSFHSVDSSELAFRTAGRIGLADALPQCAPYLLEPVWKLTIVTPGSATSRVSSAVSSRRGQVLGIDARDGWSRWDRIEALLPESELHGLDAELRSLSQGLASYEATFDHLAELSGKHAEEVANLARQPG